MKITGIEIERFGVWKDLSLALGKTGVSVVYGPNEAGKTTLMRFIRAVLYGFEPFGLGSATGRPRELTWEGTLRVSHQQRPCEIHRISSRGTRGVVSVTGLDREEPSESLLREMINGTDEAVFQNVLAVGLSEVQELATLHADEVARHIYGMSLGPTGRRLLDISTQHQKESARLLDREERTGELIDGIERKQSLAAELEAHLSSVQEHAELSRELHTLQDRVDDLKEERAELEHQLRGHEFLDRVWTPWKQVRDYEAELEGLPEIAPGFPHDGLSRLNQIEEELRTLTQSQAALNSRAEELRVQADAIQLPPLVLMHAASMQSFVDQRDWLASELEQRDTLDERLVDSQRRLDDRLGALGPEWSLDRLCDVDGSPAMQHRLVTMAARYRSVLTRRARLKRQIKRISAANHQRTDELNGFLRELGGKSVEDSLASARRQLSNVEEISRLRMRANEIELRQRDVAEQIQNVADQPAVPRWFPIFLAVLALAGLGVTLLGLHFGLTTNALGGASFALLGLTGLGIVWGFRSQFGFDAKPNLNRLQEEARQHELSMRTVREDLARLADGSPKIGESSPSELIRDCVQRLTKLERLEESQQRLLSRRRRLSELRLRFRSAQRDVSTERQNWCELLTRLGLTESVRIETVFDEWRKVLEAEQCRREIALAEIERQSSARSVESVLSRLRALNESLQRSHENNNDPLATLAAWEEELIGLAHSKAEAQKLHDDAERCRQDAAAVQTEIDALRLEQSALLVQGGATSRDEFAQRATIAKQRQEIEELSLLAREELEAAAGTAPDLAVVEEDLENYDADQNTGQIEALRQELADLEQEFHTAIENRGRVKQLLQNLEENARPEHLRIERADAEARLQLGAEEWFAVQLAGHALGQVRTNFERTCQPAVLASASRYLERLTRGRYRNIWTPLDRRELRIDDDHGLAFSPEQLSGGTREQLFLAVRLAVIRELARQGIELPMVLDDILVNFDQIRTESAVDTLLEFAGEGQQILFFTCHLHLAHLFESRGIEPIWLPGHNPPIEERLAG